MDALFARGLHTLHHLSSDSAPFAYIIHGGLVMVPLLVISAVMWMLVFERVVAFHRLEFRDISMIELVHGCRDGRQISGSRGGLRSQLGRFFVGQQQGSYPLTRSRLDEYYLKTLPNIDRHIDAITTLAMVCPLLGLLGTVSGMITTFDVIALFGTGHSKALCRWYLRSSDHHPGRLAGRHSRHVRQRRAQSPGTPFARTPGGIHHDPETDC
nr:MotA/TolQ/ExbB proton channel family protein [Desulfuromonas acetoxidans]